MHKKCSEIRPWLAQGRPRAMAQQTSWGTTRCGGSPCLPRLIRLIPSISKHSWVQAEYVRIIKFPNYPEFRWFSYAIWHTIAHTSASSISSIPCFFLFLGFWWFLQRGQVPTAGYPDRLVYIQGVWSRQQCSGGCSSRFPTLGVAALRGDAVSWHITTLPVTRVVAVITSTLIIFCLTTLKNNNAKIKHVLKTNKVSYKLAIPI